MEDDRSKAEMNSRPEPEYQRIIVKKEIGLRGFVVIDTMLGGGGTGGIRMSENVTLDEIASLAREMTLKFSWLNICRGGAKAGIVAPQAMTPSYKKRLCEEFGKQISDLLRDGQYMAGEDLGIDSTDYDLVKKGACMETLAPTNFVDSNYFTALTVLVTAQVLTRARGSSLSGTTVLMEGFGKVSSHLVRLLLNSGALIVGVSTAAGAVYDPKGIDIDVLLNLKEEYSEDCVRFLRSGEQLERDELFLQPADLLVPGARPFSINEHNFERIKTPLVVPIANIPATETVEQLLFRRGITYVPGFVSNCGGILSWQLARLTDEAREELIRTDFAGKVKRLVTQADRDGRAISYVARQDAHRNLRRMLQEGNGNVSQRMLAILRKFAPNRLGYAIGKRLLGENWSRKATTLCRWHYRAIYFR